MRNMSFSLTTDAVRAQTKTVTRRLGWKNLKPGDCFRMVVKAMGLKKGEKVEALGYARVVSNDEEPLERILRRGNEEAAREGFPKLTAIGFLLVFCEAMRCDPDVTVQRIEFEYVTKEEAETWDQTRKTRPSKASAMARLCESSTS